MEELQLTRKVPDIQVLLDATDNYLDLTQRFAVGNSDINDAFIKLVGTSIAFRTYDD